MSCTGKDLTCPGAPKTHRNGHVPLWEKMRRSGLVRSCFAFYTPDDIREIDCEEKLRSLYIFYTFPDMKLRGEEEEMYCTWMSLYAWGKLFKV